MHPPARRTQRAGREPPTDPLQVHRAVIMWIKGAATLRTTVLAKAAQRIPASKALGTSRNPPLRLVHRIDMSFEGELATTRRESLWPPWRTVRPATVESNHGP